MNGDPVRLDESPVNAIIPLKRPSDDVVQTAPVKCRYTQSGICANIAGFCLCTQANFACRENKVVASVQSKATSAVVAPGRAP
jgi:hypothetical protein